ncbi:hypothetical protein LAZ67_5002317 [Cordylochernes scorpioides]|uniref:CCHC-type domain-containing protein n=1 Tax=Cordylochernes scorpioides TaxID=51811 RepID=A0ABY6KG96_9ARAC|nr:hypothetical protein LAZ67_5002317 [Cordylochernes scorpioides]
MEEMDAIKKRRKAIRGTFTRIINEINGEFEKSQIDRNDIYSKFNRLESYYTKLVDLNEKYQALLVVKEGITEESIDKEWQECDKYEEEKFDIQQKVSVLRNPDKEETIPIASEDTVINVKLPELALKSYDGSLECWLPWWAQFSKIHENKNLSDSDRFLYLRQAIVPNSEAYRVVASYPVTGANYVLAVQALQERFGDPNILTELYVRRLLNSVISNVKKENRDLSSLYDELSSHLRSLETLGIDPQLSGIFLYPLVESSLPLDILKIWHRHPSSGYGMELAKREESDKGVGGAQERLRLLLDFLKAEVRSAQRLKFVEKGFRQEEPYKRSYNDGTRTRSNFRPATVSSLFGGRTNIKCFFCERTNHASHQCRSIMKISPGERNDKIRSAHLCFKCLRKGHIQSQCREQLECKNCGRNHLEVLCEGNSSNRLTKPGRENLKENAPEPIASLSSQACTGQVLLMTTVALLRGPNASRRVRILLDSGSQFSYIKQSLVWSIGIERKGEITIAKSLFGGNKIGEEKHGKFMLELENLGNKRDVIHIEALDQRKICDAIPPLPKGDWLEKLKIKGIILSQDNFKGQEIDILIGANYLGMILTGKIVQVEADLTAVETKLGWTLMGNSPIIDSNDNVQQTLNLLTTRCDLKDLWDLEVLGIRDPVETCSKETRYQEIKEKFITKIQRQSDQRYSVGLPWKVEKESIPSNLDIAIKRLDISTKKMTSQNKLTEYSQIFRDWLTEGLIERVEENPLERRGYYLPHRPVYKMESKTTPIRPVFDASCLGHNGLSLNQCLEKGPNLLERIPEMMIRFRENKFGVKADIRKAFQMVAIEESERNYLRFLWWEKESGRELIAYRHKRLVFGLNCSPFVLNAVIEYHLQSIRGPLEFQKAAIEIMDRAKMDLREWEYSLEENPEKGTCTKILGVVWNKMEDSLKCELPDNLSLQPKLTKRLVLSMVQRIFDPLGFCAPVFLPPKLLLQRSWGLKLGWDTPLPESMAQEFRTWLDQIKLIELIKIPRYMWNDLIFPTEVHIFCDASQRGYGAVAYLRSETGRENTLTLIWSKVRLAPMKSITIPRLELMAMVLGARLANAIQAALKRKCETTLWSDSTTALSWIKKEIEWRVFVRNRVREIQATTNLNDWRFVPSQLNPADLLSRGCPPSQFVQSRWWEGPEWLKKPKEFWPNSEFSINPKEINVEENIMKTRELKQRFLKEYLGALIQKSENIDRRQLKVGDVVLIGQENLKRMFWPKGRIVNLIPGKDGIVRVAHVKTSTGTLIRALQRLHPLEISSNVKTILMDNSNTEPQSDAFLGNRPNIESRDSRNRYVFNGVNLDSFIREVELKARVGKWDPEVKALLMFEALSPEVRFSLEEMGIRNDSSFKSIASKLNILYPKKARGIRECLKLIEGLKQRVGESPMVFKERFLAIRDKVEYSFDDSLVFEIFLENVLDKYREAIVRSEAKSIEKAVSVMATEDSVEHRCSFMKGVCSVEGVEEINSIKSEMKMLSASVNRMKHENEQCIADLRGEIEKLTKLLGEIRLSPSECRLGHIASDCCSRQSSMFANRNTLDNAEIVNIRSYGGDPYGNLPIVKVNINGNMWHLLYDTGSQVSIIDSEKCKVLKENWDDALKTLRIVSVTGQEQTLTRVKTCRVGNENGIELGEIRFWLMSLGDKAYDGILGINDIRRFNIPLPAIRERCNMISLKPEDRDYVDLSYVASVHRPMVSSSFEEKSVKRIENEAVKLPPTEFNRNCECSAGSVNSFRKPTWAERLRVMRKAKETVRQFMSGNSAKKLMNPRPPYSRSFDRGDLVMLAVPKTEGYSNVYGPFRVEARVSDVNFKVRGVTMHDVKVVHVDRMKALRNRRGADTPRKSYKQRLVDGTTSKKIPRAEFRGRRDVEENPTSRVSWTGKDALEYPSSSNLRTEKDVLDNQRVVTIRQPTRDNWTSHKTRKACDGAATPENSESSDGSSIQVINRKCGSRKRLWVSSDSSDCSSKNIATNTSIGRKRSCNPDNWARNIQKQKRTKDSEGIQMAKIEKENHLEEAERARSLMAADRKAASDKIFVFSFDLEKALAFPKLTTSAADKIIIKINLFKAREIIKRKEATVEITAVGVLALDVYRCSVARSSVSEEASRWKVLDDARACVVKCS